MLEACFGVVVAAVVTASLVAVVMAIADHPQSLPDGTLDITTMTDLSWVNL